MDTACFTLTRSVCTVPTTAPCRYPLPHSYFTFSHISNILVVFPLSAAPLSIMLSVHYPSLPLILSCILSLSVSFIHLIILPLSHSLSLSHSSCLTYLSYSLFLFESLPSISPNLYLTLYYLLCLISFSHFSFCPFHTLILSLCVSVSFSLSGRLCYPSLAPTKEAGRKTGTALPSL